MPIGIRRYERFGVEDLQLSAKTLIATRAELDNISMGGACITARQSIRLEGKHLVKLQGGTIHLTLPGTVVWEKIVGSERNVQGEVVPVYQAGVVFSPLSAERLVKLKDFIRISGIPYEQKISDQFTPGFLRFSLRSNGNTVLYHTNTLRVRKISLGGMLVRIHHNVEIEQRLPMAIKLPGDSIPIRFKARITSCVGMGDAKMPAFDMGVEYLEMSDGDRNRLNGFVDSFLRTTIIPD